MRVWGSPDGALDASLSREAMELLVELTDDSGASLLIISHDIHLCQDYANRTMVMYGGRIVEHGASRTLAETATHPYTIGLLRCVPTLESANVDELPTVTAFGAEPGGSGGPPPGESLTRVAAEVATAGARR